MKLWNSRLRHFFEGLLVVVLINVGNTTLNYINDNSGSLDPLQQAVIVGLVLAFNDAARDYRKQLRESGGTE